MIEKPEQIGCYHIIETLGQGGMGIVYKGCHKETGKMVALKTIQYPHQHYLQTIRREISVLTRLRHPGIISIVDFHLSGGQPWYAMELIDGISLRTLFRQIHHNQLESVQETAITQLIDTEQTLADEFQNQSYWTKSFDHSYLSKTIISQTANSTIKSETNESVHKINTINRTHQLSQSDYLTLLTISRRLCGPLSYLHGEGIVYRDLKPENILIQPDGMPVIVDFGLFSHFGGIISREILHISANTAGTVHYMAPEQIRGEYVDARADLYSLGCLLFELFSGYLPFPGDSIASILNAHLYKDPPKLSEYAPFLPKELCSTIHRLLAKKPHKRQGHVDTVARVLKNLGAGNGNIRNFPRTRSYLYRPGFTGRTEQLNQLKAHQKRLIKGNGSFITIEGESGVGKTRLAMEFGRIVALQDGIVLTGECLENSIQSLQAFRKPMLDIADLCRERGPDFTTNLFGKRLGVLMTHFPELEELPTRESIETPAELPAQQALIRLYSFLWETINNLTQNTCLLIIIDDIQWADETTLNFIDYILRSGYLINSYVMILGTCRSEEKNKRLQMISEHQDLHTINLFRMQDTDVFSLIRDMLAIDQSPEVFSQFLIDHCEGNPLFVAEYLKTMVDNNMLMRDEHGEWYFHSDHEKDREIELRNIIIQSLPVPISIKDLITRRLNVLDEIEIYILQNIAALNRDVPLDFLLILIELSESDVWSALTTLFKRQILEEISPQNIRFVHGSVRKVVYDLVGEELRTELHKKIALGIENVYGENSRQHIGELARHWNKAGDQQKARIYYILAAQNALKLSRYSETVEYCRQAHSIEKGNDARKLLADAYYGLSKFNEALEELDMIIDDGDITPSEMTSARLLKAWIFECFGDYEKSLELSYEILNDETDEFDRKDILRLQGVLLYFLGKQEEALEILNGLKSELERKDRNILSDREFRLLASTIGNIGIILDSTGRYDEALLYLKDALDLAKKHGDRSAVASMYVNLGNLYFDIGKFNDAYIAFEQSRPIYQEIGYRRGMAASLNSIGAVKFIKKEYRESLRMREIAMSIYREMGDQVGVGTCLNNIGVTLYQMGENEKSLSIVKEYQELSQQINDTYGYALALKNMGILMKAKAELDCALDYFKKALSFFRKRDFKKLEAETLLSIATTLFVKSEIDGAMRYFRQSLELARTVIMKNLEAEILIERTRFNLEQNPDQACKDFRAAEEIITSLKYEHLYPEITALQARLYSHQGNHKHALELLSSLHDIIENTEDLQLQLRLLLDRTIIHLEAGNFGAAEKCGRIGAEKAGKSDSKIILREFDIILTSLSSESDLRKP